MWESVGRSAFTLRGGEGAPPGVGKTGMRVRGATQVSSSKGGRAGPLAFAGDEVSLAGWEQLAIYKGWGCSRTCFDHSAAFLWGLRPRSAPGCLEKGPLGWLALPRVLGLKPSE